MPDLSGHALADTEQPGAVDLPQRAVAIATAAHADEATARALRAGLAVLSVS